nr:hypothetical protein [Delftia sp. PS-11]
MAMPTPRRRQPACPDLAIGRRCTNLPAGRRQKCTLPPNDIKNATTSVKNKRSSLFLQALKSGQLFLAIGLFFRSQAGFCCSE